LQAVIISLYLCSMKTGKVILGVILSMLILFSTAGIHIVLHICDTCEKTEAHLAHKGNECCSVNCSLADIPQHAEGTDPHKSLLVKHCCSFDNFFSKIEILPEPSKGQYQKATDVVAACSPYWLSNTLQQVAKLPEHIPDISPPPILRHDFLALLVLRVFYH